MAGQKVLKKFLAHYYYWSKNYESEENLDPCVRYVFRSDEKLNQKFFSQKICGLIKDLRSYKFGLEKKRQSQNFRPNKTFESAQFCDGGKFMVQINFGSKNFLHRNKILIKKVESEKI